MSDALIALQIALEDLATPDFAVGTVAGAIVGDAERRSGQSVFGQHGSHMGMMVLDRNDALQAEPFCDPGREVSGMEVANRDRGVDPEQADETGQAPARNAPVSPGSPDPRCAG